MSDWDLVLRQVALLISVLEAPEAELPDEVCGQRESGAKRVVMARKLSYQLDTMLRGALVLREAAKMFERVERAEVPKPAVNGRASERQAFGFAAGRA